MVQLVARWSLVVISGVTVPQQAESSQEAPESDHLLIQVWQKNIQASSENSAGEFITSRVHVGSCWTAVR